MSLRTLSEVIRLARELNCRQPSYGPEHEPSVTPPANAEARSKQVFVRLEPYYYEALGRLSSGQNWYRGTYLAYLVHVHVDRRPLLCEAEINGVRQVARQLADMGRNININQIAKKLNTSLEYAYVVKDLDFDLVQMLIALESNAVKELLRANIQGSGVSEAEL